MKALQYSKKMFASGPYASRRRSLHKSHRLLEAPSDEASGMTTISAASPPKWDVDWDKRSDLTGECETDAKARFIMLIRAGQPIDPNSVKLKGLTELGKTQARITGIRLNNLGYPVPLIYHSDMADATETASIIAEQIRSRYKTKLVKDPMLNENVVYPPDPPFNRYSDKMYFQNTPVAEHAFRKYFHRPKESKSSLEVFVGHGNMIRYMICRALQLSASGWARFAAAHCSMTTIIIQEDSKVFLNSFGEVGHLPQDHITGY